METFFRLYSSPLPAPEHFNHPAQQPRTANSHSPSSALPAPDTVSPLRLRGLTCLCLCLCLCLRLVVIHVWLLSPRVLSSRFTYAGAGVHVIPKSFFSSALHCWAELILLSTHRLVCARWVVSPFGHYELLGCERSSTSFFRDVFLFGIQLRVAFLSHTVILRQLLRDCCTTQLLSATFPQHGQRAWCHPICATLVTVWRCLPATLLGATW